MLWIRVTVWDEQHEICVHEACASSTGVALLLARSSSSTLKRALPFGHQRCIMAFIEAGTVMNDERKGDIAAPDGV